MNHNEWDYCLAIPIVNIETDDCPEKNYISISG